MDDLHALHLARRAVGNLNLVKQPDISLAPPEEPLYPADDIYGIVGDNVKKNYDIREVIIYNSVVDWCRLTSVVLKGDC